MAEAGGPRIVSSEVLNSTKHKNTDTEHLAGAACRTLSCEHGASTLRSVTRRHGFRPPGSGSGMAFKMSAGSKHSIRMLPHGAGSAASPSLTFCGSCVVSFHGSAIHRPEAELFQGQCKRKLTSPWSKGPSAQEEGGEGEVLQDSVGRSEQTHPWGS